MMRINVLDYVGLIFVFVLFLCRLNISKSEDSVGENVQTTANDNGGVNSIKYNLIKDEITEPNKFQISYEVTYGEFIFSRSEKCQIIENSDVEKLDSQLFCSGQTKFSRIGDDKNITNLDIYTYSSNGFNHTSETFKVSGNYYRVKAIDLMYGLQAEPISLKSNATQAIKKLQFDRTENNQLSVNLAINSTFFAMNRTENFTVGIDDETATDDLICVGQVIVLVRHSDTYQTLQKENFTLGEDYSFVYIGKANFLNKNGNVNYSYYDNVDNLGLLTSTFY